MSRYVNVTDTAKLVRAALKAAFPGVKFGVRSSSYSGGASIDVSWTDGPFENDVKPITNRYQACDFDGMQDLQTYRDDTLIALPGGDVEVVHFGAHYVTPHRKLSEAYLVELEAHAAVILDDYSATYGTPFSRDAWYEGVPCEFGVFPNGNGHNLLWWLSKHIAPGAPAPVARVRAAVAVEEGPATYTPREAAEAMAAMSAPAPMELPGPVYFCDKVMRVMSEEDGPDPAVGQFLLAVRGYLIARDEAPFAFEVLRGYRMALVMLLAVDSGLPDANAKIDATISEALSYWMRRGYR